MTQSGTDVMSRAWDGFPLSKQQEHVLGLNSDVKSDRTVAVVELARPVDRARLGRAARDVVAAHESLRTSYRRVLGEHSAMLMVIEDDPQVRVSEVVSEDRSPAALAREEPRWRPRDAHDREVSLTFVTHPDDRCSLVLSAPRMSLDAASVAVFLRDLQDAYAASLDGTAWTRDDVVQYADYAQWQIDEGSPSLRQQEIAAERQARLETLPPLRLPLELHSVQTDHEDLSWTVPEPLARRLRAVAAQVDGGLRSVLLTGWAVALWHAAGRPERLAVETTLARRPFQELLGSIGQFESSTPVLVTVGDETALTDLLRSVDLDLDAFENAEENSVAGAGRRPAGVPGFRYDEVIPSMPAASPFADLWVEPSDRDRKVALVARVWDGQIRLTLRYQGQGMAEGGAEALLTCLRASVSALGSDLSAAVAALPLLDEEAARELVATTNASEAPVRPTTHWHRQFERTADRVPDAPALRSGSRRWSYRELDAAANRLATELIERGVGVGAVVGLCLERSDTAVVAMLAIAKAGAGYVPVDPTLPPRRRSAIIEAVGFTHAVATAETAALLPADCDVVALDADLTVCDGHSSTRHDVAAADDDPAYVLFTSGSTGSPKGVLVGHGQLAAYLEGVLDRLRLSGAIDAVALGTLGTDLGNTALFSPLLTGGELLVVPAEVSADAQQLAELLAGADYDLLKITPSHLEALFTVSESPADLMPRQALVLGGEPLGWGSWNLFQSIGGCRIFNHYGPTETTVGVLCGPTASDATAALASSVPLGTPMRHARAYLLDPQRRPVPRGLPGELWIGGSSVAQGYLIEPEGQEPRFIDDPFSPVAAARMYRTGDKARFLPDGSIEFLGRIDRQIKVRGFRVELGEIEAVMRAHPRVTNSLVVESGATTAAHLVGYLVDGEGSRGSAEWLREFMAERLPEFMVPTHFVALDAFPLTGAGKIDASMLPEPGVLDQIGSSAYAEPRTPTERQVADIMAGVLLLERVGADDDFFEIGGHSLLATALIARLRAEFAVPIKLRTLFQRPVVSELAEFIDQAVATKAEES